MLLKRMPSEHGAGYPDKGDRPCGFLAALKAERYCAAARDR
jgi:hypothetical protein